MNHISEKVKHKNNSEDNSIKIMKVLLLMPQILINPWKGQTTGICIFTKTAEKITNIYMEEYILTTNLPGNANHNIIELSFQTYGDFSYQTDKVTSIRMVLSRKPEC